MSILIALVAQNFYAIEVMHQMIPLQEFNKCTNEMVNRYIGFISTPW